MNDYLQQDGMYSVPLVTRFEVVDKTGRAVVAYNVEVELSIQDNGRTLKVFLEDREDIKNES